MRPTRERSLPGRETTMPIPIVVINLETSSERRERITTQLDALKLEYTILRATDKRSLTPDEIQKHYSEEKNRRRYHLPLSAGEIACYISHTRAWRMIIENHWDAALILEDDVLLTEALPAALQSLQQRPQPTRLAVKLASIGHKPIIAKTGLNAFSLVDYRKIPTLTCAYVLGRENAQHLLQTNLPFGRPVDVDFQHWWEHGVRSQGLRPYPVISDDHLHSDIHCRASVMLPRQSRPVARAWQRFSYTLRCFYHNGHALGWWATLRSLLPRRQADRS